MVAKARSAPTSIQGTSAGKSLVAPGDYTMQYGVLNNNSTGDVLVVNEPNEFGTSRIERHLVEKGFVVYATEPSVQIAVEQQLGAHSSAATPRRLTINRSLPGFAPPSDASGLTADDEPNWPMSFIPAKTRSEIEVTVTSVRRGEFFIPVLDD